MPYQTTLPCKTIIFLYFTITRYEELFFFGEDMEKSKAVITIETHRFAVIRPFQVAINVWCEKCLAKTQMATPEKTAELTGTTTREIYRQIENGTLHFTEVTPELILICSRNIQQKQLKKENKQWDL
jgi:hypothetical protein